MNKHVKLHVIGRVQGVAFRYSTRSIAKQFNIKGYVQNKPDGSVYIEAEGEEKNINDFIKWCEQGPIRAAVKHVAIMSGAVQGFEEFVIK